MTAKLVLLVLAATLLEVTYGTPYGMIGGIGGTSPLEMQLMLLQYRDTCVKVSGSDAGFQQLMASLQPAQLCLMRHVDMLQMVMDAQTMTTSEDKRIDFFQTYCPQLNESLVCFDGAIEGIATCVGEDTDQVKMIISKILTGALELLCKNDGEFITEVKKPNFKPCLDQLKAEIDDCKATKITKETPFTRFNEEQCREFQAVRNCMEEKVTACGAPALLHIADVVYNPIFKTNNCEKYTSVNEITGNDIEVMRV